MKGKKDAKPIFIILAAIHSIAWAEGDHASETLCSDAEDVYFSCELGEAKKIASVCAFGNHSSGSGYVQYRYGERYKIEFQFPANPSPSHGVFSIRDVSRTARGLGTHIKFNSGDF